MYPQVASLASLYGGANGVQNTGRVAAPVGAPSPQPGNNAYFRTGYMPLQNANPQPANPQPLEQDLQQMQMTPAQRQLYMRYMRLPGQAPATAPRPMGNRQVSTAPIYAAAQKPPQSGTAQYQSAPTPQPMSPTPQPTFVNSTNNDFLTTPTQPRMGPQGDGMSPNWNPGVGGLAQYYTR